MLKLNPFKSTTIFLAILFILGSCIAYFFLADKEMAIRWLVSGFIFCLFWWALGWYLKPSEDYLDEMEKTK